MAEKLDVLIRQLQGLFMFGPLTPTAKAATYTAANHDLVVATAGTFTVTSPVVTAGSSFGVSNRGTGTVTVAAATGNIFGPGSLNAGAASFALKPGGFAVLVADGTNWTLLGGGPSPSAMTFSRSAAPANPTFTASATSSTVVVTHGLGVTPENVQLTLTQIPTAAPYTPRADTFTATTFSITVFGATVITSSACLVNWAAYS